MFTGIIEEVGKVTSAKLGNLVITAGDVLREIPKGDIQPILASLVDAFCSKEAHLSMPGSAMGVSFKAMVLNEPCLLNPGFACAFFLANSNRDNLHVVTSPGLTVNTDCR